VGGSSHDFVRDHHFLYGGVRHRYVGAVHSQFWTGGLALMRDLRPYQRPVILLTLVAAGLFFLYVLGYGLVDIVGMLLSAGSGPAD
jgi:hypothetical protein